MNSTIKKTAGIVVDGAKITLKLLIIFGMILALLVPQFMISGLVKERSNRKAEITRNIAHQLGGSQDVIGPILCVPYEERQELVKYDAKNKKLTEIETVEKVAFFTAEELSVMSKPTVKNKEKSIYKIPYFESENQLAGHFTIPDFSKWEIDEKDILWDKTYIAVGLSELKGITTAPTCTIEGELLTFEPGRAGATFLPGGMHVKVGSDWLERGGKFDITVSSRGTGALNFASTAKSNTLSMESNWPHPNFESALSSPDVVYDYESGGRSTSNRRNNSLPTDYTILEQNQGFTATWAESQFSVDQPRQWLQGKSYPNLQSRLMGTKFINVADHYSKTKRSVKYMAMIIALVFLSFFLMELLKGSRVHPFQYIMVGGAIAVFFVLLLALSEYVGFNKSYLAASLATISLVGLYSISVFKNKGLAFGVSLLLAILFVFIFVILIAVEYSLLLGAIGLFLILALVMYFTRNVKWYGSAA